MSTFVSRNLNSLQLRRKKKKHYYCPGEVTMIRMKKRED